MAGQDHEESTMDWASAAIGPGGIVVAAMGLLFTYRTRLSPYQQTLPARASARRT
jgi:hypothetical protein